MPLQSLVGHYLLSNVDIDKQMGKTLEKLKNNLKPLTTVTYKKYGFLSLKISFFDTPILTLMGRKINGLEILDNPQHIGSPILF
jgi:hypothetical protein